MLKKLQQFFIFLEIWKNTAIMSSHVFSMLHRYRPNFSTSQFSVWLDDFQKEFRSFYDLGFVGDINHVSTYTLEMLPLKGIAIPSMAIDLLKYDSIMSKLSSTAYYIEYEIFTF